MRVVLVSSPGAPARCHWSQAAAAELARVLLVAGAGVEWFRNAHGAADMVPAPPGVLTHDQPATTAAPLHRVMRGNDDPSLELALTRSLRARPAAAVVHIGTGAHGSPNVLWLADRMGSASFAVVRAAEVVCHRGDLTHVSGAPCADSDDPRRCSQCCARSWLQRPRAMEFQDRRDLLLGGLAIATAVFVSGASEGETLANLGVSKRVIVATHDASVIAARMLGQGVVA